MTESGFKLRSPEPQSLFLIYLPLSNIALHVNPYLLLWMLVYENVCINTRVFWSLSFNYYGKILTEPQFPFPLSRRSSSIHFRFSQTPLHLVLRICGVCNLGGMLLKKRLAALYFLIPCSLGLDHSLLLMSRRQSWEWDESTLVGGRALNQSNSAPCLALNQSHLLTLGCSTTSGQ